MCVTRNGGVLEYFLPTNMTGYRNDNDILVQINLAGDLWGDDECALNSGIRTLDKYGKKYW